LQAGRPDLVGSGLPAAEEEEEGMAAMTGTAASRKREERERLLRGFTPDAGGGLTCKACSQHVAGNQGALAHARSRTACGKRVAKQRRLAAPQQVRMRILNPRPRVASLSRASVRVFPAPSQARRGGGRGGVRHAAPSQRAAQRDAAFGDDDMDEDADEYGEEDGDDEEDDGSIKARARWRLCLLGALTLTHRAALPDLVCLLCRKGWLLQALRSGPLCGQRRERAGDGARARI
jgi:hypothetical protein